MNARRPIVPDGHYYSPVIDIDEAERDQGRIWPEVPEPAGIDFDPEGHDRLLARDFPRLLADFDYPDKAPEGTSGSAFYNDNGQFGHLDARSLFVMLRALRPRRMIEVGSGFSSLLTADVNRRFLGGRLDFTCIEPYPPAFLRQKIDGITRLVERRIQDVPAAELDLGPGDILFIDSSHVSKTGSDVNHLYFEILPRLEPGVIVHIHDIFLPHDYPKDWVFGGRSWNEQYLVQSLLTFSKLFRVLFSCAYAYHRRRSALARALGGEALGGCSLWLERTRPDVSARRPSVASLLRRLAPGRRRSA